MTTTSRSLDESQVRAVEAPLDRFVVVSGPAGSGKTTALLERHDRVRAAYPEGDPLYFEHAAAIEAFAFHVLHDGGKYVREIDDVEGELLFRDACAPLFSMQWPELLDDLDPEVPALRSPERFLESAYRLVRKLRDAAIGPDAFLERALRGATEFYAKPPNLADPALLLATKDLYQDSLDVTPAELQRQYRREVDLAKIVAKLYGRYVDLTLERGCMTGRDAVAQAARYLAEEPVFGQALRTRHGCAFVDRGEELTAAQIALLESIFTPQLSGVTLAIDPASAVSTARVAQAQAIAERACERIELAQQYRTPSAVAWACGKLGGKGEPATGRTGTPGTLELYRAKTRAEEALFVADRIRSWLDEGVPPARIAVLFRSVRNVEPFERALLDREVAFEAAGDVNVFADRRALDALALLWNVYDPFAHDWMLRTLAGPALGLSDASLAILCSEPPSPQAPLFVLDDEPAPTVRATRWDPKRDLRLGWNVVKGDRDAALSTQARERLASFRHLREGWVRAMTHVPFDAFVRKVWGEGLPRDGAEGSARARTQKVLLSRLLDRLIAFRDERDDATLGDVLAYASARAETELESCEPAAGADAVNDLVTLASIEAVAGREFDRVAICDVRAGAFPRWYAPDAFSFSPRLGMIPKENSGDARASRTAKFTYYMFRSRAREAFNARERRALVYALRRARETALVTASGPPTRGVAAPELFEELR